MSLFAILGSEVNAPKPEEDDDEDDEGEDEEDEEDEDDEEEDDYISYVNATFPVSGPQNDVALEGDEPGR